MSSLRAIDMPCTTGDTSICATKGAAIMSTISPSCASCAMNGSSTRRPGRTTAVCTLCRYMSFRFSATLWCMVGPCNRWLLSFLFGQCQVASICTDEAIHYPQQMARPHPHGVQSHTGLHFSTEFSKSPSASSSKVYGGVLRQPRFSAR